MCLKIYLNGMGFRAIERVTGVHHTTVITWVKSVGELLPDAYPPDTIPEVGELDELETFVGSKKNKIWTAVDHFKEGILGVVVGDHSAETFRPLWEIVRLWQSAPAILNLGFHDIGIIAPRGVHNSSWILGSLEWRKTVPNLFLLHSQGGNFCPQLVVI